VRGFATRCHRICYARRIITRTSVICQRHICLLLAAACWECRRVQILAAITGEEKERGKDWRERKDGKRRTERGGERREDKKGRREGKGKKERERKCRGIASTYKGDGCPWLDHSIANGGSVRSSVRHTRDPCLSGSRYRNAFLHHTIERCIVS